MAYMNRFYWKEQVLKSPAAAFPTFGPIVGILGSFFYRGRSQVCEQFAQYI